jgi:hypothetical protein
LEFVVWAERPAGLWFQLPRLLASALPAGGPGGLWLQADGCCSGASWVEVEVTPAGNVFLNRGWQPFALARGLQGRCTLHFRYDGAGTLFVRVFGEDGRRVGCCPEGDSDDGELELGDGRSTSGSRSSSSGGSTSSSDYAEPPRRRARTEEGSEPPRRCAQVKEEEEDSD